MRLPNLLGLLLIGLSPGGSTAGAQEPPPERVTCCAAPVPHAQPVNVAANVQKRLLQSSVQPKYPADSRGAGKIVLQVGINEEGAVYSIRFLSCPPSLREAVKDAVCQWRYRPNFVDRWEPIPVLTIVEIAYNFGRYRI
jgi:outer membrane biosynthesis protein TonB